MIGSCDVRSVDAEAATLAVPKTREDIRLFLVDIALLRRFLPAAALPQIPDHVQRVTVRVMTKAERFSGGADLIEVGTGARDIAPGMDPKPVIHKLVEEALVDAAKRLYGRLTAASLP